MQAVTYKDASVNKKNNRVLNFHLFSVISLYNTIDLTSSTQPSSEWRSREEKTMSLYLCFLYLPFFLFSSFANEILMRFIGIKKELLFIRCSQKVTLCLVIKFLFVATFKRKNNKKYLVSHYNKYYKLLYKRIYIIYIYNIYLYS